MCAEIRMDATILRGMLSSSYFSPQNRQTEASDRALRMITENDRLDRLTNTIKLDHSADRASCQSCTEAEIWCDELYSALNTEVVDWDAEWCQPGNPTPRGTAFIEKVNTIADQLSHLGTLAHLTAGTAASRIQRYIGSNPINERYTGNDDPSGESSSSTIRANLPVDPQSWDEDLRKRRRAVASLVKLLHRRTEEPSSVSATAFDESIAVRDFVLTLPELLEHEYTNHVKGARLPSTSSAVLPVINLSPSVISISDSALTLTSD